MEIVGIENDEWLYVKASVSEYKVVMQELQKKYLENPDYEPQLSAKKMKDGKQKDLEENEVD